MTSRGGKRSNPETATANLLAGVTAPFIEMVASDLITRVTRDPVPTDDPDEVKKHPISRRRFVITQCNSLAMTLILFMTAICYLLAKTELMNETMFALLNTTIRQFQKQNEYYESSGDCECECPATAPEYVNDP